MLALVVLVALAAARRHQDRYQSSCAFDYQVSSTPIEKGYSKHAKGLYWPKCTVSSLFGQCNLADFDVNMGNVLGSGGYGKVYLGRHKPSGKAVALKQISAESLNPKHVEFEETIHHSLHHPLISKFHCSMRDERGNLFFAIEYIPGGNLGGRIGKRDRLSRSTAQRYTAEIVSALEYLHSKCIVYRDLKASNLLVSKRGHIKLIDFGLSVYDCDNKLRGFAGTLEYAAPEMAAHKTYGREVDYYSLGILVFRMVTGRLPVTRNQVGMDKPEFLAMVARGFPFPSTGDKVADDLIAHLCDRDPAARWGVRADSKQSIRQHPFFHGFHWGSLKNAEEPEASLQSPHSDSASRLMVPLGQLAALESASMSG